MSERPLPPARHETEDITPRVVAMLGVAALGMLVFAVLATLWLFSASVKDRSLTGPVPVFPAPSLQTSPRSDMAAFRVKQRHELESYGWIDRAHDVTHVPIEHAMSKLAADGVPGWPAEAVKR